MADMDAIEQHVDAVLRGSSVRLRVAMSQTPAATFHRPRPSGQRSWMLAVAVVVVVAVGLVVVGTNRNDRSFGSDPSRLYWVVTRPPVGMNLVAMSEPGRPTRQSRATTMLSVYATGAAPLGPLLSVKGSLGRPELEIEPASAGTNFRETTIDGRRAAFADGGTGARLLFVETNGHWVEMTSRNIDDATLAKMAQAVVRDADGTAFVPEANLLEGLTLVVPADAPAEDMFVGSDFSGVSYGTPDGRSIGLEVYSTSLSSWAMVGLQATLTQTTVAGASGFVGSYSIELSSPHIDVQLLTWQRDGLEFRVTGFNVTDTEVRVAAESVERVSDSRWNEMLTKTGAGQDSGTAAAGTVPPEPAPDSTDPPLVGDVRDVSVEVAVTDPSSSEQVWSGTLPTGEMWTVHVSRVFDSIALKPEVDGLPQGMSYGTAIRPGSDRFRVLQPTQRDHLGSERCSDEGHDESR